MTDTVQRTSSKKTGLQSGRPRTILRSKSVAIQLIHDGKNMTPKPLNPEVYQLTKERQIGIYEDTSNLSWRDSTSAPATTYETPRSTLQVRTEIAESTYGGSIFHGSIDITDPLISRDFFESEDFERESSSEMVAHSGESLTSDKMKPAHHISLVLSETNTTFILDIPTCIALKDTDKGEAIEKENQEYIYLTEGKGRNRRVVNAEVQTIKILNKSRGTEAEIIRMTNEKTFASNWDMYDTYDSKIKENKVDDSLNSSESDTDSLISESSSVDSYKMATEERQLYKLLKNSRFQEAVCVVERLLANNYFNEQQKRFRGLSEPDIFRENIEYKYCLNLLWTFANASTNGHCVSAFEWNPVNQDLIAVGYGKFYFVENNTGMIFIWNIKNPIQPERTYFFSIPDPNLLAVGFYNGHIVVIDITKRDLNIIGENVPGFEVVWNIVWRPNLDPTIETEQICASFDDGRVIFYSIGKTRELEAQQMMRVAKADGKLKGYNSMRKCSNLNIPVSRYAGARFIRWHPEDSNIYLVGTNEGVVHKCSTNYINQHLDLFLAHDGPVNELKYSPFSRKIYATCGDDWHLRIWAEGIADPLHELYVTMMSVQSMDWSPTHSTILATVFGKTILLWDFQRKIWKPQSETQSPSGATNTVVEFTKSGRCLVVGDVNGNVHVFALEDMPFPAFFQENLLFDALERSLATNIPLKDKIKKLRLLTLGNFNLNT
ncbi:hypothetical protein ABEB36_003782 [Hypothenemus hampei]|uniref:Dynein axonemal intermediate chain 4 n=1 Tax=Hypothenemus hampei TaxID=57062 RepID=A0ABD1F4W6_HYPHA